MVVPFRLRHRSTFTGGFFFEASSLILGILFFSPYIAPAGAQVDDGQGGVNNSIPNEEVLGLNSMPNMKMPTLGGKQFWTDYVWLYGWRIQKNALTGHFRLLDPSNFRHAWGTREHCQQVLQDRHIEWSRQPPERVVVLAHGLMRSSGSMSGLAQYLKDNFGLEPILFEYASTQGAVGEHAQALRELIEGIPGQPRIDWVAHSMGNIVMRHAIADWQRGNDPKNVLPRLNRMVMLGPPNQGAMIARRLAKTGVFGVITGKGGLELGRDWSDLEKRLATPPFPFAVVAGNLESNTLQNPLVNGASDFVVSLEEAKLEGMSDFMEVPVLHSFLMDDPSVQQAIGCFLDRGVLRAP